ncbi:ribosome biogenesis GTPase YlqF [Hathewaya histolytica]|uniref:ribosome biogenesis GTPase YlqF n=1 Tax=Hathewaya histolytica TaxID=1498 RepID=UPI003B685CF9
MEINWYPGHMAKAKRGLIENLKLVDVVIEIRDARIVKSSANPDIDSICKDKPRLILLNKYDLAEDKITDQWISNLNKGNIKVIKSNSVTGDNLRAIKPALNELLKEKHDRLKSKGLQNIVTRAMVVGIPNVGKSSFINKMAKNKIAKTGDKPGVTKSNQWIKTKYGIELLDTPGVLWPKFQDKEVALHLAFTGAIKDEIMDIEDLALKLVEKLQVDYTENLIKRYKLECVYPNALETMESIAKKRGCVMSGGVIDYNRVSIMLLDEFRGGKLGGISLDRI